MLEGKVEFFLNGEGKVVGPFSSFYCPPNVEHGIRNVGDTEAKYLVVKKYAKEWGEGFGWSQPRLESQCERCFLFRL